MKIEIQGQDTVETTEELLAIEGLEGSYETLDEVEREGILATILSVLIYLKVIQLVFIEPGLTALFWLIWTAQGIQSRHTSLSGYLN